MKAFIFGIIISMSVLLSGCAGDRKIDEVVSRFQNENVGDLRENVFDISFERVGGKTFILSGEIDDRTLKSALMDTLIANGFYIEDSVVVLPHNVSAPFGIIDLSVATMRSSASHTAPMVSQALMGMPVRVLKEKGGWVYIQTPDRYLGWCEKAAVQFTDSAGWKAWKKAPKVMVTSRCSVIRDKATGNVVGDLVAGCLIEETGRENDKVFVTTPAGITGFVNASDIVPFDEVHFPDSADVQELKKRALSLLRTPYLWGGTSVHALDCSGFTKTVYRLQGIVLARDASLQAGYGEKIPVDQGFDVFKTGDLLFFAPRKGSDRITHVGLYIGDSEFIHEAGKVKINSLDSTRLNYSHYRAKTLVKARRINGCKEDEGIVHLLKHPWYAKP